MSDSAPYFLTKLNFLTKLKYFSYDNHILCVNRHVYCLKNAQFTITQSV